MDQCAQQTFFSFPSHYIPLSLIAIIKLSVMDLIIHLHDEWHKILKSKHKKGENLYAL